MPKASPPIPAQEPALLEEDEAILDLETEVTDVLLKVLETVAIDVALEESQDHQDVQKVFQVQIDQDALDEETK